MIITPDNSGKQDIILDNLQNNNGEIISKLKKRRLHLRELALSLTDTLDSEDRDDGVYSPEELTERFVRGDQSRTSEGNGLGLSIAKSLTELQNGTMNISVDGDLFKVTLKFPLI